MARIVWLDDKPLQVRQSVAVLRTLGNEVIQVKSEQEAIESLRALEPPDVLIQNRNRSHNGEWDESAGGRFFKKTLTDEFPDVPVIFCTKRDTTSFRNAVASWNVQVVAKSAPPEELHRRIRDLVLSQRKVLKLSELSFAALTLDFENISTRLIKHLASNRPDVHSLSWRAYQKLVATLLREMGYEVEERPLTRHGGVDILALQRSSLGDTQLLVDAKKYRPDRQVGPVPVRAIHGVATKENASVGMIVTTSRFSPAAKEYASELRFRLSLKDFDDVCAWIAAVSGSFKEQ